MNDLVQYIMQRLQQGGTSVASPNPTAMTAPGTAVARPNGPTIIDGEWSEVPRELRGPNGQLATRGGAVSPYVHEGDLRGPLRGGSVGGYKGMSGPTLEGQWSRVSPASGGSFAGGMFNPLLAAIMGSVQGDVLNKHQPRMYGEPGPANPMGQVTGSPLPQIPGMGAHAPDAPSPPISGPQTPPPMYPGVDAMAAHAGPTYPQVDPMAAHASPQQAPMPRPRPQMARAPVPMPQARPQEAPSPMGFFQRNAAMMFDPVTGAPIDPQAAARARASFGRGLFS